MQKVTERLFQLLWGQAGTSLDCITAVHTDGWMDGWMLWGLQGPPEMQLLIGWQGV